MQRNVLHLIDRLKYHAHIPCCVQWDCHHKNCQIDRLHVSEKVTAPFYPEMPP